MLWFHFYILIICSVKGVYEINTSTWTPRSFSGENRLIFIFTRISNGLVSKKISRWWLIMQETILEATSFSIVDKRGVLCIISTKIIVYGNGLWSELGCQCLMAEQIVTDPTPILMLTIWRIFVATLKS